MNKKYRSIILQICLLLILSKVCNDFVLSIFWIILHEISHIIVAGSYGCSFNDFHINITGVTTSISDVEDLTYEKQLHVYLVGPFFNFIIVAVTYILFQRYNCTIIKESMIINLSLLIFNLLPAYPLDGSRICEILLTRNNVYRTAKKYIIIASFIIAVLIMLAGAGIILFLHKLNISFFLAAAFIFYTAYLEKEKTMYIVMGDIYKKFTRLKKNGYIESRNICVYYQKGLVSVLTLVDKNKYNIFHVLNEDMKLIKIIYEDELLEALKQYGNISLEEYVTMVNEKLK